MRSYTLLLIVIFNSLLFSTTTVAQWYTVQGSARTTGITSELAREMAIENALKKALLVAGASISSVQQVMNGLLTQDEISIRASGTVNTVEIIDEIYKDDLVTITIRADVLSQEKACFKQEFKKSVLLTKSHILNREQAHIGEIYQLDSALIRQLQRKLFNKSENIESKNVNKNKTQFSRLNNSSQSHQIKELTMSLSDISHSQYVLYSEINNLSMEEQRTNNWSLWEEPRYPRTFDVTFYLYNGINGELVWQQQYKDDALWDFSKRKVIDVNGSQFWQSEYGEMVDRLLSSVVNDLDGATLCEPSKAKVVKVDQKEIVIDLGRAHGVKIGDEFTLVYSKNYYHANGEHFSDYHISDYKVKVIKLTQNTATVMSHQLTGNIQINDLAIRY
jgi:hypothetical protein